ncbi:hypothetical protein [Brevundimonas phoenicis]|uniref:hypothetical protein n=1 Tax=unclassified Brevundimonas TaxID=2622653 RepID=UPI0039A08510
MSVKLLDLGCRQSAFGAYFIKATEGKAAMRLEKNFLAVTAYVGLGVLAIATITVGALYHFASNGDRFQPWLLPMCILTLFGSVVVDRFVKSRSN